MFRGERLSRVSKRTSYLLGGILSFSAEVAKSQTQDLILLNNNTALILRLSHLLPESWNINLERRGHKNVPI